LPTTLENKMTRKNYEEEAIKKLSKAIDITRPNLLKSLHEIWTKEN
jgi:hypothetical protein